MHLELGYMMLMGSWRNINYRMAWALVVFFLSSVFTDGTYRTAHGHICVDVDRDNMHMLRKHRVGIFHCLHHHFINALLAKCASVIESSQCAIE